MIERFALHFTTSFAPLITFSPSYCYMLLLFHPPSDPPNPWLSHFRVLLNLKFDVFSPVRTTPRLALTLTDFLSSQPTASSFSFLSPKSSQSDASGFLSPCCHAILLLYLVYISSRRSPPHPPHKLTSRFDSPLPSVVVSQLAPSRRLQSRAAFVHTRTNTTKRAKISHRAKKRVCKLFANLCERARVHHTQ